MVEMQKEEGYNLLLWDTYTVDQIYDTQTDEDRYFLRLKFKSQSSLALLHNSAQRSCSLTERQSTSVDCAMHIQMRSSTYDP